MIQLASIGYQNEEVLLCRLQSAGDAGWVGRHGEVPRGLTVKMIKLKPVNCNFEDVKCGTCRNSLSNRPFIAGMLLEHAVNLLTSQQ